MRLWVKCGVKIRKVIKNNSVLLNATNKTSVETKFGLRDHGSAIGFKTKTFNIQNLQVYTI